MGWECQKRWSDRFLPEMKSRLGQVLICEPPIEEDQSRNTDLIVLKMDYVRIACRIRRFQYLEKFGNQFTIRCGLKSNSQTELDKVVAGWGDLIFYGFCDESETKLAKWFIGDLNVFRSWYCGYLRCNQGVEPGEKRDNKDGTSLRSFCVSDLPSNFIVKGGRLSQVAA